MESVLFGVDVFCGQSKTYKNSRLGLVTNNAATTSTGTASRVALLQAGFNITTLFSPEHGLSAKGGDGAYQGNHTDAVTQLPVISLYGDHLYPTKEELSAIDIMVFDIPDVGCRFYTYLWTMTFIMEACASLHKPFIVLDRPNPAGADLCQAEGPWLDEVNCSSFIGRWNIPVRHSCTLGELANFFAATRVKNLDLRIVKVQHWNRLQTATAAGWHFVPTSPAITDPDTAVLYSGMGMLEGINVNEGRGTGQPFKKLGAPWIDAKKLKAAFENLQLPGITGSVTDYIPGAGLYDGEVCHGLQFELEAEEEFRPVTTAISLLQLMVQLYPEACRERLYPTLANPAGTRHLDKLTGVHASFDKLKTGSLLQLEELGRQWKEIITPYLLY